MKHAMLAAAAAGAMALAPSLVQAQAKPDVIFFLADDFGVREAVTIPGPNGPVARKLPGSALGAIDQLAARGVTYTNAYGAPACIPARAMPMTGRWQWRRSQGAILGNGPQPPGSVVMLPEMLKPLGYTSALVGKWHLGTTAGKTPIAQGFDYWFGFVGVTPNYVGHDPDAPLVEQRPGQAIRQLQNSGLVTNTLANKAIQLLSDPNRTKPLFLAIWWTAPHDPLQGTLTQRTDEMDAAMARIIAAAPRPGNTIFIFAGDNGRGANNAPLKGRKYDIFEGGVRVPLVIRWDGHLPAGSRNNGIASLLDLAPTLLAAADGAPRPSDGINLLNGIPSGRAVFFQAFNSDQGVLGDPPGTSAVRQGPWKLLLGAGTSNPRLYNLQSSLGETTNVAGANPGVVADLTARIQTFRAALSD